LGGAVALTALAIGAAYPGAWTQEQGSGDAVLTGAFTTSDHAFAPDGQAIKSSSFTKTEVDLFSEYGLRDWLTTIIQGGLTSRRVGEPYPSSFEGFDVSEFGARLRLWQHGNAVFSVQVAQVIPGGGHGFESAQYGNTDPGTDLRVLAGCSFKLGQWNSFIDGEAAYHFRAGRPPSEYHFDFTLGTRPRPDVLLMSGHRSKLFVSISTIYVNDASQKSWLGSTWEAKALENRDRLLSVSRAKAGLEVAAAGAFELPRPALCVTWARTSARHSP
jgi:protein XagA